ncbi:MAG: AAA family ATPase [Acidobacteriota bacterium]
MPEIFSFCPSGPPWRLEWEAIDRRFEWIRALRGCPQNPRYHAEGDVWVHTRLVCEALIELDEWRALDPSLREDLFVAALLHDAAKPECTRVLPDGRITSRGHARRGALQARRILWRQGVPVERRERICALVHHHMVPLYLRDSERRERQVVGVSQTVRCDHLAILGRADALGRITEDAEELHARHDAYARICREVGCFDRPYPFDDDHQRFLFFRRPDQALGATVAPAGEARVTLLCGLPGSGRRPWAQRYAGAATLIDLDALRRRYDVGAEDNQGAVVAEARCLARDRLQRGADIVWSDTNLSRRLRAHLLDLFAEHEARVRIVYLERDAASWLDGFQRRGEPESTLTSWLDRWEVPDLTEAHELEWRVSSNTPLQVAEVP